MPGELLSIGEISRRLGIPVTTLRFYEQEFPSLLRALRTSGGHRRYTAAHLEAFRFIQETSKKVPLRDLKAQMPAPDASLVAMEEKTARLQEALVKMDQRVRDLEEALKGMAGRVQALEEKGQPKKKWFK
jgi:MerR family redox-sensitive transcriptional activator SoxR